MKQKNKKFIEKFIECDTCGAKPGSPALCYGCLYNREVIFRLQEKIKELRKRKYHLKF